MIPHLQDFLGAVDLIQRRSKDKVKTEMTLVTNICTDHRVLKEFLEWEIQCLKITSLLSSASTRPRRTSSAPKRLVDLFANSSKEDLWGTTWATLSLRSGTQSFGQWLWEGTWLTQATSNWTLGAALQSKTMTGFSPPLRLTPTKSSSSFALYQEDKRNPSW